MTKTEIIEQANRRTERRAEKGLNLSQEYIDALQEFAQEHLFFWRKRSAFVNTSANSAAYDLPADFERFIGVYQVDSTGKSELFPVTRKDDVADILEQDTTNQAPGAPSGYTLDPEDSTKLRISPVPDGAYKIRFIYWATPNPSSDDDVVPLVPPQFHKAVAKCLEKNLLEFLFGPGNNRVVAAEKKYYKMVEDAKKAGHDFAVGVRRPIDDPNPGASFEAVRAY